MDRLFIVALFALAWIQKINGVEQFVFHGPTEEMVEVPGISMEYPIDISRTSDIDAELLVANTITLTSNCPAGVTPTASSSDYSVKLSGAAAAATLPLDVEFPANAKQMTVIVTINDDSIYEGTEIFCMSIQPDNIAGSQNTITVSIPENDFCYEKNIPGITTDYTLENAVYAGPWTPSIDNTVDITVTPEAGTDITIFLTTDTDQSSALTGSSGTGTNYYSIVFDDSMGTTHGTASSVTGVVNGDTLLFLGNVIAANLKKVLNPVGDGAVLMAAMPYRFWLRYTPGQIDIGLQSNRADVLYTYTEVGTPLVIKHIFVQSSAAANLAATFEICHTCPKKITPVGAVQNMGGGNPMRAIDGGIGPLFETNQCFVTGMIVDPWLRIDLGKVYEVTNVVIWPVTMNAGFDADPADMEDAKVFVGNCPPVPTTNSRPCFDVTSALLMRNTKLIESNCPATAYGQYVYIYKAGTDQFSFCEVEIYGKEVSSDQETTVQFQEAEYEVNEDVGTYTIYAIRTYPSGVLPTCTLADYYTDRIVTPASGNSNDFDPIPANPPTDANPSIDPWVPGDITGTMKPIDIKINDSPGVCEPIETFNVYLTNIVGGIAGTPTSTTIKIKDTDVINYSFSMASYSITEGTPFMIDVTRTGNAAMQQGTAGLIFADVTTTANDYATPTTSVSFNTNSGQTEPVAVLTTDDNIYELTESLTVGLGALTPNENMCSMMGSFGMATLMITDNDSRFWFDVDPGVTIVIPEGQSRTIDILREGTVLQKNVEIIISEGGTPDLAAVLGNDFTITPTPSAGVSTVTFESTINKQAITITTENDSNLERAETFTLTLRDPLYPDGNRGDPFSLSISIVDNDAEYFWKQNSYSVTEGDASVIVCVLRTGEPVAKSIVITTVAVSALVGPDFEPIQRIMFEENEFEACAPVTIAVDTATESTETFMMKITSEQDVVTNPMSDTTTVSILDDDTIISFSPATYNFREGQSGLSVMISKTGNPSVSFTLTITSGTATQNNDFILNVASSSPLTIPTGTTSLTLPITIIDDVLVEQAEQFTLTISGASGGTITTPTATITITDNDVATPIPPIPPITTPTTTADSAAFRWVPGDYTEYIPEDRGSFYIDVEITREGTAEAQTVYIRVHETTAKEGSDFSLSHQSLTFPAGNQNKQRVTITIIDDGITEAPESFKLTLEDSNENIGDELTFNIQDNDGVFISEQSGFVSRNITFQCDITRSRVPADQFGEYTSVQIYKQSNNSASVDQAFKLAEISVTDRPPEVTTSQSVHGSYTFRLLTDLELLAAELAFYDLKLTDSGYFWCVFSRPSNPESFFALQQTLLRVNPCVAPGTLMVAASDSTCVDLAGLTMVTVEENNVMEVATVLVQTTDRPDGIFTDTDVLHVGDVIEHIVAVGDGSTQVTGAVAESVSNLIGATDSKVPPTFQFTNNTTTRITQSLEKQVVLGLEENGEVMVVESNLAIQGVKYDEAEDDITGIGLAILTNSDTKFDNNTTETIYDDDIIDMKHPPSSIFLSSDIVESLKKKQSGDYLKFVFLAYRTDFLFASKKAVENDLKVEGVILTASVEGVDMTDLADLVEPVEIENHKEPDAAALISRDSCHYPGPECVFWDFKINDWSSEGCRYVGLDDDTGQRRKCECDHLTNFAVLVYHGKNKIESNALDIISKIGCGLSLACLTLTVILFTFFKKLRRKARTITVYLCISLIGLYLVFIIAMDWTCPKTLCSVTAAFMHYFVLTTMAWMAVEARYLYIKLVRIFDPENDGFVNRAAAVAWGVPVIIVAISLGSDFKSFQNEHYCFPTVGWVVYFAVLLPIALVLIHNIVSFALIMRTIFRSRPGQKRRSDEEKKVLVERFRHSFTITCLLGLTWVFGFFAIDTATIVFQYLFCIFNSLQGVFIFVFTCLLQKEVKNVLFSSCRSERRGSTSTSQIRSGTGGRSTGSRSDGTNFQSTSDNSEFRSAGDSGYDNRGIELGTHAR